ncbi:MAG: guanosine polyphosphate pyrophosphohydrolase [Lachnospiraceae bacterium]|jgi:hypothetical protein|nr:guanosine polyphosphate pyrophosphohydrolase [Lachnospiraceae bacterium]
MIQLTDYLYSGDTVPKILHCYSADLKAEAANTHNQIDLAHANFLIRMTELLEHNDFLTSQSQRIRDFYMYMAEKYPYLAFVFKGRIKSLIRTEEKFNGYIVSFIYKYYIENKRYPSISAIKAQVERFKDLIAYRIVISMPKCHLKMDENKEEVEIGLLYEIANALPDFLEAREFTPELSNTVQKNSSPLMSDSVRPYYRDYIANTKDLGYRSLHIALYDNPARCFTELQLRTKDMDDFAEIGAVNHNDYEKAQERERGRRNAIPKGECIYFDEAYDRVMNLQNLELSKVDVNMFSAINNYMVNDGCGLYRGRLILPFEHLSRFQNGRIG